jgi:hypothetical protein
MLARNNSRVASDTQATTGTTRVDVSDDSAAAATAATVTTVTDSVALIEHDLAAQGFTRVHPQLTATLNHTGNAGATYGYREVLWDPLHHKVALIANNPTMDQLDGNGVTIMSEKGALNLLRSHSGAWSFNRGDMHEAYVRRVENTGVTNYTSLYGTGTTTSVSTNGKGFTETVYGLNEAIYAVGETAHTLTGTLHEAKGLVNFISGKGPRGC